MAARAVVRVATLLVARPPSFTRWGENRQFDIARSGIAGYTLPSVVVHAESVTHTPPLATPALAMAASGLAIAALAAAGPLGLFRAVKSPEYPLGERLDQ